MAEDCTLDGACGCGSGQTLDIRAWWRVGVGILIAANAMTLNLAVSTSETAAGERTVLGLVLLGLALASLAILGWPLMRNAARELAARRITLEALFLTGVVGAFAASVVSLVTGRGEAYFEVVSILLVVYAFGQQVAARARRRAVDAALGWMDGIAVCRVLEEDGGTREIPVEELTPGLKILVHPGEAIPVDGVVERGTALVREAEMTGEHFAVARRPGDRVWAGTALLDASLVIRATAGAGERRIDGIVEAVNRARSRKAPVELAADRIVAGLLPAVLALAGVTFVLWTRRSGWETGLFDAMSVLLVACPCALGLATPLAVWAALGRLARRGLVARGGDVVERLASVDAVLFDKTGTLTGRRAELVDLVVSPAAGLDGNAVRELLATVEAVSAHPVAEAFAALARGNPRRFTVVESRVLPGTGVEARVRDAAAGKILTVVVGREDGLAPGADGRSRLAAMARELRAPRGVHRIAALVDGEAAAVAGVSERLSDGWGGALASLRELGVRVEILTGDSWERTVGVEADRVTARMSPEEKLAEVERLKGLGNTVLFAGDGVNDAAALAAAHVGVGVVGGAELAEAVGDVLWYGGDVEAVPWALSLARRTRRLIRSNLRFALIYNLAGIALAMGGVLHPVTATLLMVSSSLVVTWRAGSLVAEDDLGAESRGVSLAVWKEETA